MLLSNSEQISLNRTIFINDAYLYKKSYLHITYRKERRKNYYTSLKRNVTTYDLKIEPSQTPVTICLWQVIVTLSLQYNVSHHGTPAQAPSSKQQKKKLCTRVKCSCSATYASPRKLRTATAADEPAAARSVHPPQRVARLEQVGVWKRIK